MPKRSKNTIFSSARESFQEKLRKEELSLATNPLEHLDLSTITRLNAWWPSLL
jgi:hypothetical protein